MPPIQRAATSGAMPIETVEHADKRANIPTADLADFVTDEHREPQKVTYERPLLYPRDLSADPQLVWRGKDVQDAEPFEVPAVPIYIQEKIEPRAIIENLRKTETTDDAEPELSLFDDFDGLDSFDLVDFYEHEANWANRLILGDSLLVMTSLVEKEGLAGKVQTVFFDPPYGIKFGSNWQVSTRKREVQDSKETDLTRQPEQIRAFRDTWKLGVHSYLAYLRDRLQVAHTLLNEAGSVFVQIGDENVHVVRSLLDEVFGADNFVSHITFAKTSSATGQYLAGVSDFVLWYAKDRSQMKYRQLYLPKEPGGAGAGEYSNVELQDGRRMPANQANKLGLRGRSFRYDNLTSPRVRENRTGYFPVEVDGRRILPGAGEWKTNQEGMQRLVAAGRVVARKNSLAYVRYLDDFSVYALNSLWNDTAIAGRPGEKTYVVQTSPKIAERCLLMTTDPGDLVLDPTCGSGTTAYVAEQWGRRWITMDTSRVAITLARARLMGSRFPDYLLADSPEGAAKEAALSGVATTARNEFGHDVRQGFVYKRVPHIQLRDIAQNPEIEPGMTRQEIDAIVARRAESELLRDQPFVDPKKVRVAGRFTVETLSPHSAVSAGEERPAAEQVAAGQAESSYEDTVLSHLRKAGVQNTVKQERLEFDRLEAYPGRWLQAAGDYTTADGEASRVAVSLGPQHGTVGPEQIKEAAREALRGEGFDLLLICGFAFDSRAGEVAAEFRPGTAGGPDFAVGQAALRMGKVQVLLVRMNPDLAMGDTLLKNTGAGNLFMVFGEPDVTVRPAEATGQLEVEIHGVDVFDPTTGAVRSHSTDDIACWFVDSNYNGDSFFVRHAYFTGADNPYDKLKKALHAEIDADAWASLNSTVSRAFPQPSTGKIAVKVINHYGDDVLKVYEV
ncbi:adenine-specific DNA-methyltransferase [Geodermatophilus bullaregiensis]|uniref:site-specific DNA-methyltransferase n=1 Tax=Geodermatophilus bullaregiensis TaxID=1564160 RepID=UPI0019563EE0|nr:site-specific DNA-methyltransferase [Geodermatophilus bullaregiensis]MBM7806199.1 adenine-specific DNA-methyltransferase [Geodermatophilus bullaregiensis]